jgi:Na+/H+-dicarboxylate symporter
LKVNKVKSYNCIECNLAGTILYESVAVVFIGQCIGRDLGFGNIVVTR